MQWKCPTYQDLTFYDIADNANVQFLIFKSWPLTIRDLEANSRRSKWLSLVDLNGSRTHRRHDCAGKACREYKCRILHIRKRSTLGPPSAPCPFSNLYLKNSHSQAIKCLTSVQIIFKKNEHKNSVSLFLFWRQNHSSKLNVLICPEFVEQTLEEEGWWSLTLTEGVLTRLSSADLFPICCSVRIFTTCWMRWMYSMQGTSFFVPS